jgi:hypothetical protein
MYISKPSYEKQSMLSCMASRAGMVTPRLTGSPNTKFARAAGASTLARTPNPSSDAINIGVWNSLISHLPFCPKATDIIGIVLIGLSAEKTS